MRRFVKAILSVPLPSSGQRNALRIRCVGLLGEPSPGGPERARLLGDGCCLAAAAGLQRRLHPAPVLRGRPVTRSFAAPPWPPGPC